MERHLFFICPTDHLETVIAKHFRQENYYITSLGNSVDFNPQLIEEINELIEAKSISEISFILSDNNKIIMDVLKSEDLKSIRGLESFYHRISEHKRRTEVLRSLFYSERPLITQYLTLKVQALKPQLNSWFADKVKVNATIYKRQTNVFKEANADLIYLDHFCLN